MPLPPFSESSLSEPSMAWRIDYQGTTWVWVWGVRAQGVALLNLQRWHWTD